MASTTFVNSVTLTDAEWFNVLNDQAYRETPIDWCGTAGGTANALTLTPTPAITACVAGQQFTFKSGAAANTAATTVAISGLATIAVQLNGAALVSGDIAANKWYRITLDTATTCQIELIGTPTGAVPLSTFTTAGDTIQATGAGAVARLALGTAGSFLQVNAGATAQAYLAASASVAAHATTSDPWVAREIVLTGGVVTFTAIANAPYVGAVTWVKQNAAHIWTDGATFKVQGDANYTAAADDWIRIYATTTSTFEVTVFRATGAVPSATTATGANALYSATTTVGVSAATAPSSGQVLTATGSTAATWQTPSAGEGFTTGDVKLTLKTTADSGWVLMNDTTIGNGSSGGTGRANADTVDLFTLLWDNTADGQCAVSTGRGANAAADYAANKTIALPKALGRALATYGAGSGLTSRVLALTTGVETHPLVTGELAAHGHTQGDSQYSAGGNSGNQRQLSSVADYGAAVATANAGSGTAHQNMQPTLFLNCMIKL